MGQAALFLNGDPHGPCTVCDAEIAELDKPDCIPVAGTPGSGPIAYIHDRDSCYRQWLRGNA